MTRLLLSAALALAAAAPASAENWPQWRGPKNDGHSSETNLPAKWSETENVAWKLKLPGAGSSTPCVWGDKLFLTLQEGPPPTRGAGRRPGGPPQPPRETHDISLLCVGTDGQIKWKEKLGSGGSSYREDEGNMASASCSTDGKLVFAFVGTGAVAAYDVEGKRVWGFDAQERYGKFNIQFGVHQTPVLHKGRLYLSLLHRTIPRQLVALDAGTGKEIWKHDRKSDSRKGVESPDVYASPFIWEKGDQALLISHGDDYCTAHKLDDGAEAWRVTGLNPKEKYNPAWRAVSSPLVTPDLIVVPSCKGGVTVGIDPSAAKGEIGPGGPGEKWRLPKGTPDVPSPILVGDKVYLMRENGVLQCHDAATGAQVFAEGVTSMRHRASPVYADGKLYLTGRDGMVVVVKPGKELDVVAKNSLPDTFTASPAVSGGRIYLRGFGHLWAIGAK